ncbi:hypothetical protein HW509_04450 [Asaia spathodeae]|uniref:hypothetical protein n=1 Tax=Asaia spathodeae TaxID=657016 RepID=UPI002FC2FB05
MAADPHTATQRYTQVALNGEVWSAVNVSGVTRYQSGAVVVDGPIVLGGRPRSLLQPAQRHQAFLARVREEAPQWS